MRLFALCAMLVTAQALALSSRGPDTSQQPGPLDMSRKLEHSAPLPKGLNAQDWTSIRDAYQNARRNFRPSAVRQGSWYANNALQQLSLTIGEDGFLVQPDSRKWAWGLEMVKLEASDEKSIAIDTALVVADGDALTSARGSLVEEQFVNGEQGLAHNIIIANRPGSSHRHAPRPIELVLAVRGNLRPWLTEDSKAIEFKDHTGSNQVRYSGIKVLDDRKVELPARFLAERSESGRDKIRIVVDDRQASYPLLIAALAQQSYLKPSNTGSNDAFGYSVSVSGDTVVIGAPGEDSSTTGVNSTPNELAEASGAAYVFVRSGSTWIQQAYLKPGNTGAADQFGWFVSVSGDTVVVGAPGEDSSTVGINSVPNESGSDSGAAYVFVRSGTVWSQQAYLKPSNTGDGDRFGWSVSASADSLVVSSLFEDSGTTGVNTTPNELAPSSGAAYVFVRDNGTWSEQAYLKASNAGANDQFGFSVSLSGDELAVGALQEDSSSSGVNSIPNELSLDSGAAYVFARDGSTWTEQAYLKASNTGQTDRFGISVSIFSGTAVVGAFDEDSSTTGVNSVPNNFLQDSGAAYVFVRNTTGWEQQAYLKPSNTGFQDNFGGSVAIYGDALVIGAAGEDSATVGVNGMPDELALNSGAAYVFERAGTTWIQSAFVKPANTGPADTFGHAVSMSGDGILIGAWQEDGSGIGPNSPSDDAAPGAGAAYMFEHAQSGIFANSFE